MANNREIQLSTQLVFDGRVIKVSLDKVLCPNGKESYREVIQHHGGVCILAFVDGNVLLEKQYRYALDRELYELPAGKLEQGEIPYDSAMRELEEETGYKAERLVDYGIINPTCGYSGENIYLFVAEGLRKGNRHLDEDESLEVLQIPLSQVVDMIDNGTITDAKTICLISKYLLKNSQRGR